MKNRKYFIGIFAFCLACTVLLTPCKPFYSGQSRENAIIEVEAEEPTITDTQKGIALLTTIFLSLGLRFVGDWNNVVAPGIQKLWNDFSTATGNQLTLSAIVAGCSLGLGYIRVSSTVNNAINNFVTWYRQTYSQPTTGEISVPVADGPGSYTVFNQCTNTLIANSLYWKFSTSVNTRGVTIRTAGEGNVNVSFYFFSTEPFTVSYKGNTLVDSACSASTGTATSVVINGITYYRWRYRYINGYVGNMNFLTAVQIGDDTSWDTAFSYCYGSNASLGDISMTGDSLELKDGYQVEQDQAKLYDIANLVALVGELALTLENIEDLVRDIPLIYDTPWSLDYPDDPTYADTPDDTIPWVDVPDSVIPSETPEYVPTNPGDTDSYKVLGLERVFPFSIPFDLYYLTKILVAEPETPEFTYAAVNPFNGQLVTINLDLHDFDGVAGIFRTVETVLFIAFLIYITRGLIRS